VSDGTLFKINLKNSNMKPAKFKYQNITYAENQPEYRPLPALKIEGKDGAVVSCWKLSFKERIRVLIFGRVWVSLMSFNKPLTPSYLSTKRRDVFTHPDDNKHWYQRFFK